jgi:hypothetical protein
MSLRPANVVPVASLYKIGIVINVATQDSVSCFGATIAYRCLLLDSDILAGVLENDIVLDHSMPSGI